MAVRLFVTIKTLPGKGAEYAAESSARAVAVRQEAGCEQYDFCRNIDDPDTFVLVERWTSEALWQEHMTLMRSQPPRSGPALTAGGPTLERYDV